jgi:hypothetical protein
MVYERLEELEETIAAFDEKLVSNSCDISKSERLLYNYVQ